MKIIKKHKVGFIIGGVILVLTVILAVLIFQMMFPNSTKDVYGSRLDGIENVRLNEDVKTRIKSETEANEKVTKTTVNVTGRLIKILITYNTNVSLDDSKELADKMLEYFSKEELAYYDLQVLLAYTPKEDEETIYPLIAYKHKTRENFVWKQDL